MKSTVHLALAAASLAGAFVTGASAVTVSVTSDITVSSDFAGTPLEGATALGMTQIQNGDFQAYPFLKFDLSSFAGQTVTSDAVFTVRFDGFYDAMGTYPHSGDNFQLKALPAAFDAATTYDNYAGFATKGIFTRDDINGFATIGGSQSYDFGSGASQDMSFTIPQATLQSWVDAPSANFGFALFRGPAASAPFYHDQSAMNFSSSEGIQAPSISFSTSAIPEPSSFASIAGGVLLCVAGLRRRRSVVA